MIRKALVSRPPDLAVATKPTMTLLRNAALTSFIVTALGISAADAKDPARSSLTMEHCRDTATVTENPSDGTTIISTENGYVERTGPMRMVWHDEFLRGVIDRKSGGRCRSTRGSSTAGVCGTMRARTIGRRTGRAGCPSISLQGKW